MARSAPWRRRCPSDVAVRLELAQRATLYIVHQTGPTAFVVQEETGREKKSKVLLGGCHACSCSSFRREKELCIHILWVLLKKFRVPCENPISWQLGLVEREIMEILHGVLQRQPAQQSDHSNTLSESHDKTDPKAVGRDDVCPICQEGLLADRPLPLTFCKFGCGNSIHVKCMKIWADHQRSSSGNDVIKCPLCREDFGTYKELCAELHTPSSRRLLAGRSSLHFGVTCSNCHVCPVRGKCYRCCTCACYHLCQACFSSNQFHVAHPFQSRQHTSQPWRPAARTPNPPSSSLPPGASTPGLPPTLISALQSRSLTESDYELLLGLEQPLLPSMGTSRPISRGVPNRVINSLHVEPVNSSHPLLLSSASCSICSQPYTRGCWLRRLPCTHKFHRDCIDQWLHTHLACPIDGQPVYHTAAGKADKRRKQTDPPTNQSSNKRSHKGRRATGPSLSRTLPRGGGVASLSTDEFSVSGYGIRHTDTLDVSTLPSPPPLPSGGRTGHKANTNGVLASGRITGSTSAFADTSSANRLLPQLSGAKISGGRVPSGGCEGVDSWCALGGPASPPSVSLSPVCSGYVGTAVAARRQVAGASPLPSLTPARSRVRRYFGTSGCRHGNPSKGGRLDPSLCVSSFKLYSLPPSSSLLLQS